MPKIARKVTLRLYPSQTQAAALEDLRERHRQLYNAALEHRIGAWRRARVSVSKGDQEKEVTEIRALYPEYAAINAQSLQVTLDRLDKAFQGFFRRVRQGETPGFPRFKSRERFKGFGYKSHGDGWKLFPGEWNAQGKQERAGRIRISGVGMVRTRGRARLPGEPKTCEIVRKGEKWYASVSMVMEGSRERGTEACAFDWGISSSLTLATPAGIDEVANPRFDRSDGEKVAGARRDLARKQRGSRSRAKAKATLLRRLEKVANRRRDFLHKLSAALVKRFGALATEKLTTKRMTRSARGSVEEPGKNVKQKAGLNRSILDGAPATFVSMVRAKAEEAGALFMEANTRKLAPTQRCHACWKKPRKKKGLGDRIHHCEHCGASCGRDENAALVLLRWLLEQLHAAGDQPKAGARQCAPETPPRAA